MYTDRFGDANMPYYRKSLKTFIIILPQCIGVVNNEPGDLGWIGDLEWIESFAQSLLPLA